MTKPSSTMGHWVVVAMVGACALAVACGSTSTDGSSSGLNVIGEGTTSSGGASGGPSDAGGSSSGDDGGSSSSGSVYDAAGEPPNGATEPNLKVAFIGDTAAGANFKSVLQLVKNEGADLLLVQGDLTYNGDNAADWFPAIDNEINGKATGSTATVTIPYFVSKGNHDVDWGNLGSGLKARMGQWGIAPEHNDPTLINYSMIYKGLKIVLVDQAETANPTRADYVKQRLQGDTHLWKLCSWHKNQRASNVGPKNDEMPWPIYENCRAGGAIVAQGHSHTYSRSKTLTADATQAVDPACADPFALCVAPGKHFFFDSSLGGTDTRPLNTTVAAKPYWGQTYTGSFGALFIEFHVNGDPKKAHGYFKNIGGTIIDPPASSGKTFFEITSGN